MINLDSILFRISGKLRKKLVLERKLESIFNDNYIIREEKTSEKYVLRIPKENLEIKNSIRKEYEGIGYSTNGSGYKFRNLEEQVSFISLCQQKNIPVAIVVDAEKNYMLTEFIEGKELPNILKNLDFIDNINLVDLYLSSLISTHEQNIIMGDRWCYNTIFTPQKKLFHIDFDIELSTDDAREFELSQGLYYSLLYSKNKKEVVNSFKDFFYRKDLTTLYDRTRVIEFLKNHSRYFHNNQEYGIIEKEIDQIISFLKPKSKITSSATEEEKTMIFIYKNKRCRLPLHPEVAKPNHYTKLLAEHIILADRITNESLTKKALDIGPGNGVYEFILVENGFNHVHGIEINAKAVQLSREFIRSKGLENHVRIFHGKFPDELNEQEKYDLILTNPPQIPTPTGIQRQESSFYLTNEGGSDGREIIDEIILGVPRFLNQRGYFQIVQADFVGIEKTLELMRTVRLEPKITATRKARPGPFTTSRIEYIESLGHKFKKDENGLYFNLAVITGCKK